MELPGSTDLLRATLDAVSAWPRQRERLPEHRADLLAAAWWAGNRNVTELAVASGVARDTVYRDLRSRGIDPMARHLPADDRPRYIPLRYGTVDQLASLMSTLLGPSMLCSDPGPLPRTAWMMNKAMTRIADLLDPSESPSSHTAAQNAEDLVDSLSAALEDACAHWAGIQTDAQLAARALDSAVARGGGEAIADRVTIELGLPNTSSITVTLGQVPWTDAGAGYTTIATDSPLLDADVTGRDHLEIRAALNIIAGVLTRHLAEDAFDDT